LPFALLRDFDTFRFGAGGRFLRAARSRGPVTAAANVQILAKRCRIAPLPFDQSGSDIDVALPKLPKDSP